MCLSDTGTSVMYTLSLHDALPISYAQSFTGQTKALHQASQGCGTCPGWTPRRRRSEEHTSELQSLRHLVCRLLREKKNITQFGCRSTFVEISAPSVRLRATCT